MSYTTSQVLRALGTWRGRGNHFQYGTVDCCQFAAHVVAELTGVNYLELFDPYRTRREAMQILAGEGGFERMLSRLFGEPQPIDDLTPGDVVLINMNPDVVGVLVRPGHICALCTTGFLLELPANLARKGWHICRE